jgi:hypothetical protein
VKLSLCLTKFHTTKTYWVVEVQLHAFLTSAQDGGELSASRPGRFTAGDRTPGKYWLRCWVGPRAGLERWRRERISSLPCRKSNHGRPAPNLVTTLTELPQLPYLPVYREKYVRSAYFGACMSSCVHEYFHLWLCLSAMTGYYNSTSSRLSFARERAWRHNVEPLTAHAKEIQHFED